MRGRGVDEEEGEGQAGDRATEVARSVLSVYEYRFGPPPAALLELLEEATDVAEISRWLTLVARSTAAQLAAELGRPRADRQRRRSVTGGK